MFDGWTNTTTNVEGALPNAGKVVAEGGLSSLQGIGRFGANQLLQNGTSTMLDKALGGDSQFDNALRSSLANTFAAAGFNWVGDVGKQFGLADGGAAKIGLHAVMGGLAAEASGGDFKSGALAACLNEAVVDELAKQYQGMPLEQKQKLLAMNAQLIGAFAAAAGGGDGKDLQTGAWAAQNSTLYNRQLHPNEVEFASDKDRVRRFAAENGLTEDQAQQELLRTAAAMVDRGWNSVLTDGNTVRAADYLRTELSQFKDDTLFQVSLADYNNERVGLIELFQDKTALKKMLDNVALVDPLDYRTDVKYMREVLNAKGQGSQEGLASALEGMASGPSKAALWAMGAANCPSCAANDVADAWNAALELPTELRLKGYLDNLHIMQGSGAEVVRAESASSTELGVGIGVAIGGGLGGGKTGLPGAKGGANGYVDIISPEAKQHILYGDKPGSGGHMWPGQAGKTTFPQNWSADKIVHEVGDVATSPSTKWYAQTGTGGVYTSKGDPAKWVAYEVRDGVRMRVVYQPATGKVITAFPDNAPIPPYKLIK